MNMEQHRPEPTPPSSTSPTFLEDFKELFDMVEKAEKPRAGEDDRQDYSLPGDLSAQEFIMPLPELPEERPARRNQMDVLPDEQERELPEEQPSPPGEYHPTDIEEEIEDLEKEIDDELKKEKQERKLKWHGSDYGMLGVSVFSFVYLYLYFTEKTDNMVLIGIFFGIIVGTGIVSGIIARLSATNTFPLLGKMARVMKGNFGFAIIKSPYSQPSSIPDHLVSALRWCVFPTLVVFFFLSYIAEIDLIVPEGESLVADGFNLFYIFLFLLPAVGIALAAPLRILSNSSLVRYNVQERTIEPFGNAPYRVFRAVGGVGALAAFLKVALKKSGVILALQDTFMILMFVLPTMFIATLVYSFWHLSFVRKLDEFWEQMGYQEYSLTRTEPWSFLEIRAVDTESTLPPGEQPTTQEEPSPSAPPLAKKKRTAPKHVHKSLSKNEDGWESQEGFKEEPGIEEHGKGLLDSMVGGEEQKTRTILDLPLFDLEEREPKRVSRTSKKKEVEDEIEEILGKKF